MPCVSRMVSVDVLDSTQNLARELAWRGCEANTLVLAYEQTAACPSGHGCHMPRGGVYFTLVLRPEKSPRAFDGLAQKAAQAVARALQNLFHFKTKVNRRAEVSVWDGKTKSWKKIGAVCVQNVPPANLLVSVFVNVNNRLPSSRCTSDTSVKKLLGREIDPEWVLQETLDVFWTRYAQWQMSSKN